MIPEFDIVINTIPAKIFGKEEVTKAKKSATN